LEPSCLPPHDSLSRLSKMSMFSSAFKSISATNITGNYSISSEATSTAGPWRIHDAKKKSNGKAYSVFIFDRKSLDSHGNSLGRSGASSFKRAADEVVERLKKEASSLAKLRHPNILELVEPVEDTRGGGLQFVSEAVTASLSSLLAEKDDRERSGGPGGRSSRFVVEDADGVRRRRELEIDELEIQKGLLQISKALEFMHDNAGLVHGNLTPDAILINAKSDWKISGLSFCSPAEGSTKPTSIQPISLSEVLNIDPRLPRHVQLNLDYSSPDFVIDNNLNTSADMFSLGLLCISLYNSPHRSPLETHASVSTYKRLFSSSSTVPSTSNKFLCSGSLPRDLSNHVLPRLITRRPAQRMSAKDFQESEYFDNILVSTIRFLDAFPAKTAGEKSQFLRGLVKVLPSFPKSVMEKKLLPSLLDEMKDKDLISLILQNVFKIIELLPSAKRAFGDKVRPVLKETFVVTAPSSKSAQPPVQEKDPAKDAGLMVVLENMASICKNSTGKEFKDDILPVVLTAIESPTHSLVDAALRGLPVILPVLDFSTIKNELFPVIATVFSKTNSLQIKIRGLRAFVILCGGSADSAGDDGLDGLRGNKKSSSSSALDKYTMQEKIVPLIKAIKTKEPAVMMAAHDVLKVVGDAADIEFVAMDILPVLWTMSLGPLLSLQQFQTYMDLIKHLSRKVEDEHSKKLQELSGPSNGATVAPTEDFVAFGGLTGTAFDPAGGNDQDNFEALVKGRASTSRDTSGNFPSWDDNPPSATAASTISRAGGSPQPATFSWSTPSATPALASAQAGQLGTVKAQQTSSFRTVTPDLSSFGALTPTSTQFSKPLQPTQPSQSAFSSPPLSQSTTGASTSSINWPSSSTPVATPMANPWASTTTATMGQHQSSSSAFGNMGASMNSLSLNAQRPTTLQQQPSSSSTSSFSLPPPPSANAGGASSFSLPPPQPRMASSGNVWATQASSGGGMGMAMGMGMAPMAAKPAAASPQNTGMGMGMGMSIGMNSGAPMGSMMGSGMGMAQVNNQAKPKSGLDKYDSLL
ncbi:hypothetical protein jhhlp_003318, partial [Lomentospora prolificans]